MWYKYILDVGERKDLKFNMELETIQKVRAILLREGRIAVTLSKRSGAFMLPGGKIELGESKEESLKREILEELGIEITEEEIIGPFFQRKFSYQKRDKEDQIIQKTVITSFYVVNTTQDFDVTKMHLTEREIARASQSYWINPAKLEYDLTMWKGKHKSNYARRYAQEFLETYREFKNYQKECKKQEIEK